MEGRQVQGSCGPRAWAVLLPALPSPAEGCRHAPVGGLLLPLGAGPRARAESAWHFAGDVAAVSSLLCLFPHPPIPCLIAA